MVIGMHRSGTSMIVDALRGLGLFTGWKRDPNHEAVFFIRQNEWLLRSAGGRWDAPGSIAHLLSDDDGVELAIEYLRRRLSGPVFAHYLGPKRYVRYRSAFQIREPWGWKDPRTTVTLPIWLRLFPEARILHVVRNGVDVAASLARRQLLAFEQARSRFRSPFVGTLIPKRGWFGDSPRVLNRAEGFRLWEEYLDFAERYLDACESPRLEIRYEDILTEPIKSMRRCAEFCGLTREDNEIARAASHIRADGRYRFVAEPALRELWDEVKDSRFLQKYGYDEVGGCGDASATRREVTAW
jgi:hypothetical protein